VSLADHPSLRRLLSLTLCALACEAQGPNTEATETSTGPGETTGETGETDPLELTIRANPHSTISPFADVDAAGATNVVVRVYSGGEELFAREATSSEHGATSFLWGLPANGSFTAIAQAELGGAPRVSQEVSFSTGSLPEGIPELDLITRQENAHSGLVIFPTLALYRLIYLGVNPEGVIVWYYLTGDKGMRLSGDLKLMPDGRLFLCLPDHVRIIEPDGRRVAQLAIPYHHDVMPMPNGDMIALVSRLETLNVAQLGGPVEVWADGIVQYSDQGELLTQWWVSDHLDHQSFPSKYSTYEEPYDWTHANALVYDAERDRVLLSLRNQHAILAIDWQSGDVRWQLGPGGDFDLTGPPEDFFYNQHSPELQADGTLLVYDNGNERPGDDLYSRAALFHLDEEAMSANLLWDHEVRPYTRVQGDADRLPNGNVLINAGGVLTSGEPVRILEVSADADADVLWELQIPDHGSVYRATYVDGL